MYKFVSCCCGWGGERARSPGKRSMDQSPGRITAARTRSLPNHWHQVDHRMMLVHRRRRGVVRRVRRGHWRPHRFLLDLFLRGIGQHSVHLLAKHAALHSLHHSLRTPLHPHRSMHGPYCGGRIAKSIRNDVGVARYGARGTRHVRGRPGRRQVVGHIDIGEERHAGCGKGYLPVGAWVGGSAPALHGRGHERSTEHRRRRHGCRASGHHDRR